MARIVEYYYHAGMIANGIAAVSILMWLLIVEKFIFFRSPVENVVDLAHALMGGRGLTLKKGLLSRFVRLVHRRAGEQIQPDKLMDVAQVCAMEFGKRLNGSISLIQTLCALAPLIGLLGTVDGMMVTFAALSDPSQAGSQRLATGVSQALITTEMGLVVAVPGLLALAILKKKAELAQYRTQQMLFILSRLCREKRI